MLHSEFAIAPKCDRRTKAGKEDWQLFEQEADGKQVVPVDVYDEAMRVAESVRKNQLACSILSRAKFIEQSKRWRDGESGLTLKCRPDIVCDEMIVDLKTCRDASPQGFARAAADLGYHRQHAFYVDGWAKATGEVLPFVFIAV